MVGGAEVVAGVVGDGAQHAPVGLAALAFREGVRRHRAVIVLHDRRDHGQTIEHRLDAQDGAARAGADGAVVEDRPEQVGGVQAAQLHRVLHGDGAQARRLGIGQKSGGIGLEARGGAGGIGHGHAEQQAVHGVGQRRGGEVAQHVAGGLVAGARGGVSLRRGVVGALLILLAEKVKHGVLPPMGKSSSQVVLLSHIAKPSEREVVAKTP